jgi:hypothetical protein
MRTTRRCGSLRLNVGPNDPPNHHAQSRELSFRKDLSLKTRKSEEGRRNSEKQGNPRDSDYDLSGG